MNKRMAGRRSNGEGTVTKWKNGLWQARLTLPGGKRRSFYAKTKAEALKKLQAAGRHIAEGRPLGSERLTVQQWLSTWLKNHVAGRVRIKTEHRYKEIVEYHINPRLGHLRLSRLTPADVEEALNSVVASGRSPRTASHVRTVLRNALNVAVKQGVLSRNVAALADPPAVQEQERQGLTLEQVRAIRQAVKGDRLEALYLILISTGVRLGECLGSKWEDFDLSGGSFNVRRTLARVDSQWLFQSPKTSKSRRSIPLPPQVSAALEAWRDLQRLERMDLGGAWGSQEFADLAFTTVSGGPLSEGFIHHHFQKLLKRAGLPPLRIHDLRHGAASLWASLGIPITVAQSLLGHADSRTTAQIYTHSNSQWEREAMQQAGEAVFGND